MVIVHTIINPETNESLPSRLLAQELDEKNFTALKEIIKKEKIAASSTKST